jgi:hypothetical protein
MQNVSSFEFVDSLIIKSVSFERMSSHSLEETLVYIHICVCARVICSGEKYNPFSGGYIGSFYSLWGPFFPLRENDSSISTISLSCQNKISLASHDKIYLTHGPIREPKILLEFKRITGSTLVGWVDCRTHIHLGLTLGWAQRWWITTPSLVILLKGSSK